MADKTLTLLDPIETKVEGGANGDFTKKRAPPFTNFCYTTNDSQIFLHMLPEKSRSLVIRAGRLWSRLYAVALWLVFTPSITHCTVTDSFI